MNCKIPLKKLKETARLEKLEIRQICTYPI